MMTNFRRYLVQGIIILMFIFIIISLNVMFIKLGDSIKTVNYAYSLENYVKNNNLSMTMPVNYELKEFTNNEFEAYEIYRNKSVLEFSDIVSDNYYYDDYYDCKYWSYVWMNWWKLNKDTYNYSLELIDTNNHVFVMVYNDTSYCILDGNNTICMYEK